MDVRIEESWKKALAPQFEKVYFEILTNFVRAEYAGSTPIFPRGDQIFRAFDDCPFDKVRVVILGQDPYHNAGQAEGLAFSVPRGVAIPPSLRNMIKEITADFGRPPHIEGGNLSPWVAQGVLLLNATLTVRAHEAASHQNKGWETFTDAAITALARERENLVFMLWGASARKKAALIDRKRHLVLEAPHPSPLSASRGFFGCKHFSQANEYLSSYGIIPVSW